MDDEAKAKATELIRQAFSDGVKAGCAQIKTEVNDLHATITKSQALICAEFGSDEDAPEPSKLPSAVLEAVHEIIDAIAGARVETIAMDTSKLDVKDFN